MIREMKTLRVTMSHDSHPTINPTTVLTELSNELLSDARSKLNDMSVCESDIINIQTIDTSSYNIQRGFTSERYHKLKIAVIIYYYSK